MNPEYRLIVFNDGDIVQLFLVNNEGKDDFLFEGTLLEVCVMLQMKTRIAKEMVVVEAEPVIDPDPWIVDTRHPYGLNVWSIVNQQTGQTVKLGPVQGRGVNYYDRAKAECALRNMQEDK